MGRHLQIGGCCELVAECAQWRDLAPEGVRSKEET
jgi:hypothetical protein